MLQFLLTLTDEANHGKVEHIYNTYHEYMMKYAVSKLQATGRTNVMYDAEDAVQNTFMQIVKSLDKIDFSRGEKDVKNYCLTILCNEVCNVLRDNKEKYEFFEEFCPDKEYNIVKSLKYVKATKKLSKASKPLMKNIASPYFSYSAKKRPSIR